MLEKLDVHLVLSFSHWRNCRPRRTPSTQHCTDLGEGDVDKVKVLFLTFLMQFFSASIGCCFSLTPVFWDLYKGVLLMDSGPCPFPDRTICFAIYLTSVFSFQFY